MEKIISTVKLMAKTGLFFANCDGNFDKREHDFIDGFLSGIQSVGDIDDELKNDVLDTLNHKYTLDEIVEETQQLIDGFNEDERKAILVTISQFVLKVLSKDKRVDSLERANYERWKERMGIA